jgi:hypothetical protein
VKISEVWPLESWQITEEPLPAPPVAAVQAALVSDPLLVLTTIVVPLGGGLPLELRTVTVIVLVGAGSVGTAGNDSELGLALTLMFQAVVPLPPLLPGPLPGVGAVGDDFDVQAASTPASSASEATAVEVLVCQFFVCFIALLSFCY